MPNANQKTALDTHRTQVSEATSSENSNASFQSNKNKNGPRLITPKKIDVIRHQTGSEILILMTYDTCPTGEPSKPQIKTTSKITFKSIRNTISNIFKAKAYQRGVTIEDETGKRSQSEIDIHPRSSYRVNNSDRSMTKMAHEDVAGASFYSDPSLIDNSLSQVSNDHIKATDNQTAKKDEKKFDLRIPSLLVDNADKKSKNVVIRFFDQNEEYEVEPLGKDILGVSIVSLNN